MRVFLTAWVLISLDGGVSTAALYWCPGGLERERVETTPAPGCEPLVEERDLERPITLRPLMTLSNSAGIVAQFMLQYRQYLACCATDPRSLDVLTDLDRQTSDILAEQERILPFISGRT
jgi:hypothetical protein